MALFFASITPAVVATFMAIAVSRSAIVPTMAWLVDGLRQMLQQGVDAFEQIPTVLVAVVCGGQRLILIDARRPADAPLRAPPAGIHLNACRATGHVACRLPTIR
jgi:hypothetical protein